MNALYAAVVHDVKNQLTELALRLGKRADAQLEMQIAMNAARRLSEMLLVSRDEANGLAVNVDSVNPADFLAILAAEYSELFPQLRIGVNAEGASDCAFFDDALVRLALDNALHNACRYARQCIQLNAYQQENRLVLEVLDDGVGFAPNILDSVGAQPAAVSSKGTGLGLYLARRIAELHHLQNQQGSITLSNGHSFSATGGCFRMYLP